MKLLTKELRNKLPKLYAQEHEKDPMVYVKFFDPVGSWTWYVIEGEQKENDYLFFGMVHGFEKELGYFTLSELESIERPFGMKIERDIYFMPCRLSEI